MLREFNIVLFSLSHCDIVFICECSVSMPTLECVFTGVVRGWGGYRAVVIT